MEVQFESDRMFSIFLKRWKLIKAGFEAYACESMFFLLTVPGFFFQLSIEASSSVITNTSQ
jgi:hypothetical protein